MTSEELLREVRLFVFRRSAETAQVPQAPEIAQALGRGVDEIKTAVKELASKKVLILAPNDGDIWAPNPFCAVPSEFRVHTSDRTYTAICVWDALGIAAALHQDAVVDTRCGDCGVAMRLEVAGDALTRSEGIVHFGVPAHHWWDNIGFT